MTCTPATVPPVLDIRFVLRSSPSFKNILNDFQLLCSHEESGTFNFLELKLGKSDKVIVIHQLPRCKNWAKKACVDQYDDMNCRAAADFCYKQLAEPYFATGLSQFPLLSHRLTSVIVHRTQLLRHQSSLCRSGEFMLPSNYVHLS